MVPETQTGFGYAQSFCDEFPTCFLPLFKNVFPFLFFRIKEIFNFHLFKLPCAEDKIAWSDFIPESFSDLSNTKGKAHPGRISNISKIYEDALRCFGTQIYCCPFILNDSLMCFKEEIERLGFCKNSSTKRTWCLEPVFLQLLRCQIFGQLFERTLYHCSLFCDF